MFGVALIRIARPKNAKRQSELQRICIMERKKGFVTVATGSEKYYKLAANLLCSYRKQGQGEYPFALICDRENEYTKAFDDIVLTEDFRSGRAHV